MTHQILQTLLNCSWQWGILGGLTWLITRRFHQSNNRVHLLWLLFLISLPILFVFNQFIPGISIVKSESELIGTEPIQVSSIYLQESNPIMSGLIEPEIQSNQNLTSKSPFYSNWSITHIILGIWGIGTLILLMKVAIGLYRIHWLRKSTTPTDGTYQLICNRLAKQLHIKRHVTVCYSDYVSSPISFGWLAPHILIPRELTLDQFELVAAHELAHVQRLDWLTNLFSHIIGAVFFFHPIYHLLNKQLIHLREQICDDWVIQITGKRKKYAQCLLDLVRYDDNTLPLVLALNKPSWLESRIDSILKQNRRLDLHTKPRFLILAASLMITCLPLLSMAQLLPLKTVPVSLFGQTSEETEKPKNESIKNKKMEKTEAKTKQKKVYKDKTGIEVKDPKLAVSSEKERIFSGPQVGESLPPFNVTGMYGEIEGKTFDITSTDRQPLILFIQDANGVGIKGIDMAINQLSMIAEYQNQQTLTTGNANQSLQVGVVFLVNDDSDLPDWSGNMIEDWPDNRIMVCMSPDGREGPGSYGLNRNVAQTILIANDGKVVHNFAFTQPMLYTDPYVLGAVSQAIGVEPSEMEKWLNEKSAKQNMKMDAGGKSPEYYVSEIKKALMKGNISREDAILKLEDLGVNPEKAARIINQTKDSSQKLDKNDTRLQLERVIKDVERTRKELETILKGLHPKIDSDSPQKMNRNDAGALLEQTRKDFETVKKELDAILKGLHPNIDSDSPQKMDRRQYRSEREIELSDPADFKKSNEKQIFSGPQPGEILPPLNATSIAGKSKNTTYDFISTAGKQPIILFLQDGDGAGLRGLYDTSRMISTITNKSKQKLYMNVVFLGDDTEQLRQRVSGVAKGLLENGPEHLLFGISPDGREGPGSYGLNRNVSQTIIIAKEGKVLHNFAITQPSVYADSHVLGAIAQTLGVDTSTAENWLNEQAAERTHMQRDRQQMNREGIQDRKRDPSSEERLRKERDPENRRMEREGDQERNPSPEEKARREEDPEARRMDRTEERVKDPAISPELLLRLFEKDKDGMLNEEEMMTVRRLLNSRQNQNPRSRRKVDVKDPDEFKKNREKIIYSGPQPSETLPALMATVINGDEEGKTIDFIEKADGKSHILILQDETPLGLRGLVAFTRILEKISQATGQYFQIQVVFLGDSPEALLQQASKIVPHIPENILLGVSPDGREGPGSYGLNRNIAQTVIIAQNGIVLQNFPLAQPMLSPDPYVLGAISELIQEKPAQMKIWLNGENPIIKIKTPSEKGKNGEMLLKGSFVLNGTVVELDETVVQFDGLHTLLRAVPKESKSMILIQAEREVLHEQIVKVMEIVEEAGIEKIRFAIVQRNKDSN
ncbi:hypothetical protein JT359_00480 [Candidatus Poribacteria bacterium]|nr:hypothetical protein [Candidatus Poribacteria bacterium]